MTWIVRYGMDEIKNIYLKAAPLPVGRLCLLCRLADSATRGQRSRKHRTLIA